MTNERKQQMRDGQRRFRQRNKENLKQIERIYRENEYRRKFGLPLVENLQVVKGND